MIILSVTLGFQLSYEMNASESGAGRNFYLAGSWIDNYISSAASLLESLLPDPQTPAVRHQCGVRKKQGTESDGALVHID